MGLVLDTSEFIFAERRGVSVSSLLDLYETADAFAISAMTIAELQHGVRRAEGEKRRIARRLFLLDVIEFIPILPMTDLVAIRVGDLDAEFEMRGEKLATSDLIIAATALEHGQDLATSNIRHFQLIPGLRLVLRAAI